MHVSDTGSTHKLADQYIEVAKSHFGMEYVNDIMDFETAGNNKIAKIPKWINPIDGTRSDAATAFIHPLRSSHPNLHLLLKTKVSRIIFEGARAVGVNIVAKYNRSELILTASKIFHDAAPQTPRAIHARKLVVISAGALATPQILQRSGIGAAAKLQALGIENIISDLPGVGMNLRDHPHVRGGMVLVDADSADTGDDIALADAQTLTTFHDRFKQQKGDLSWNFVDTGIKYRPNDEEVKALGPNFEKWWTETFVGNPGKALLALQTFMMYPPPSV
jgi:alcohol oxidase